jgi:hypothetical protein
VIHPAKPRPLIRAKRAVACISPLADEAIVCITPRSIYKFARLADFLNFLCSDNRESFKQIWLSPHSVDWSGSVPHLLDAGHEVHPGKRAGEIASLRTSVAVDDGAMIWHGGSAAGMVAVPSGLSPEAEARMTWEQLEEIQTEISNYWPGVQLGTSIAATAISCLRQHLRAPLGCDWQVSGELRRTCYGGGRIELYCTPGTVQEGTSYEIDMRGAYATIMALKDIPGEFDAVVDASHYQDNCTISTVIVRVPESMKYPPLRVEHNGAICFPTGTLFGTWTGEELRAAERSGCRVVHVHSTLRFRARSEISQFGERAYDFRMHTTSAAARIFAKGLAVQLVGALASRPSEERITCYPTGETGFTHEGTGIYSERRFKPSEREVLSAACTITGICRAWTGLALYALDKHKHQIAWVHTDGMGDIDGRHPSEALLLSERLGGAQWHLWRTLLLHKQEVWAANQRISTDVNGLERVAAGGISKDLSAYQIRNQLSAAVEQRELTAWMSGKRNWANGRSEPIRFEQIDPIAAEKIRKVERMVGA